MTLNTPKRKLGLALLTACAVLASACSSDSKKADNPTTTAAATAITTAATTAPTSAASTAGSTAETSAASTPNSSADTKAPSDPLAEAKALLDKYSKLPKALTVPSLSAKPPTGKKIIFVACDQPNCTESGKLWQEPAKLLGWTLGTSFGPITPEGFNAQLTAALAEKPDGLIIDNVLPVAAVPAMADVIASGIPYVIVAGGDASQQTPDPSKGFLQNTYGPLGSHLSHTLLAAWVTVDSGGKGNIAGFFNSEAFVISEPAIFFKDEIARLCSGCKLDSQKMSLADLGAKLPSQVVSYVQSHKDVQYIYLPFGGATTGVAAALNAAGLAKQVKIFAYASSKPNIEAIQNGEEAMGTVQNDIDNGFFIMDAFARHFVGDKPCCEIPDIPTLVLTKDTVGKVYDPSVSFSSPDTAKVFSAAWKVG